MARSLFAALCVAAAAVAFEVPAAHAAPTGPLCAALSVGVGPAAPSTRHDAVLMGGPLVGTGTLRCSLQAGAESPHSAPDLLVSSASNSTVVTANPRTGSFMVTGGELSLCTQWTSASGTTYYLHGVTNRWRSTPAVPCQPFDPDVEDYDDDATTYRLKMVARVTRSLAHNAFCTVTRLALQGEVLGGLVRGDGGNIYVAGVLVYDCKNGTLPSAPPTGLDVEVFAGVSSIPDVQP